MPRTSAVVAAETARRVLETARLVFSERGFADASVDDIARRAGVTRGAVYHHYAGKLGLFRAVVTDAHQRIAQRVVAESDRAEGPAAELRAGCHAFLDAITEADVARLVLLDAPAVLGWREWRELDESASGMELTEALLAVGALSPEDVSAASRLLSGAMNDAALWLAERPEDERARRAVHEVLDLLLDAVSSSR